MSKAKSEKAEPKDSDGGQDSAPIANEQAAAAEAAQDETGRRKVIYYADVVPGWADRNEPPKLYLDPHAPCGYCVPVEVEIPIDPTTAEVALPQEAHAPAAAPETASE